MKRYHIHTNRLAGWSLLVLLALVLASCSIYVDPSASTTVRVRGSYRIALGNVIEIFEPTKGRGANYTLGEEIAFRMLTSQSGYVTLTAIDPDGFVYVLGPRNVPVDAGVLTVLPRASRNIRFIAAPPSGFHRVRASFTPRPTDTTFIVYEGRRGGENWTETIVTELEPYPQSSRDIVETNLFIR
jgi:hypothetical protein